MGFYNSGMNAFSGGTVPLATTFSAGVTFNSTLTVANNGITLSAASTGLLNGGLGILTNDGGFAATVTGGDFGPHADLTSNNGSVTKNWRNTYSRHYVGAGTAPTASTPPANVQFGGAPSIAIAGYDVSGVITLTTGAAPSAFAGGTKVAVSTISFSAGFNLAPSSIVVVPANDNAGTAASGATGIEFFSDSASTGVNNWVLYAVCSGAGTLSPGTVYKFSYLVIG